MTPLTMRTTDDVQPLPASGSPHTLANLFDAYARDCVGDQARLTQYNYQCFFGQVLRDLGPLPLDQLTPEVLRAWKGRLQRTRKSSTVHKLMTRLSTVLRVAVEEYGWLEVHPMQRVRKPSPGRGRVRFLTPDERRRLLTACRASWNPLLYPLVVLALSTGGRKNELRRLQWTEVYLEQGVLRFLETKTQEDRSVPLVGEAAKLLQTLAQERRRAVRWVFPNATGTAPCDIERAWGTARRQAGLETFRFHDLRHTAASYMAMSGASLRDIAEVLGHRKLQQTMLYAHLLPSHTTAVLERMAAQFLTEESPHV